MATTETNHHRQLVEYFQEHLGPHHEVLEPLSDLDNELSIDVRPTLAPLAAHRAAWEVLRP